VIYYLFEFVLFVFYLPNLIENFSFGMKNNDKIAVSVGQKATTTVASEAKVFLTPKMKKI